MVEIYATRLFSLRQQEDDRVVLVLAPRPLSPAMVGATVKIAGTFRRLSAAELRSTPGWTGIDAATRQRLSGRPVLVATAVLAAMETESPAQETPSEQQPQTDRAIARSRDRAMEPPSPPAPLAMRASTMVAYLDGFAGRPIRILDARVVGVLEPRAFLIEPATEYLKPMGERDRILVLIENGELNVEAALLVDSTIAVEGIARTLLGVHITHEVPWPTRLDPKAVDRLDVRGVILARSVQTPEGIELTARR